MAHPGRRGSLHRPGMALGVGQDQRPADVPREASEGHLPDVPVSGEQVLHKLLPEHL